jgi:hypothetical protein
MEVSITLTGHNTDELVMALEEARRSISNGNLEGAGSNDTGSYRFRVTGTPIDRYLVAPAVHSAEFLSDFEGHENLPVYDSYSEAYDAYSENASTEISIFGIFEESDRLTLLL